MDPGPLTRTLTGLARELRADVEALKTLAPVSARGEELERLLTDLGAQLERVQRTAVVVLVGATGAGKSTLLNALAGRRVAVEGETRPTTAVPVVYRPPDADVRELVEGLPGRPPEIVDVAPGEGLPPGAAQRDSAGAVLVDAPDVNSVAAEHREVVAALAARADVLVVVAHRQSIGELSSVEFVDAFAARRRLVFVLNRSDELTDAAREELLGELRRLAEERWDAGDAPVLALSARRAREGDDDGGLGRLRSALAELVEEGRLGRARRLNALGTAGSVGAVFAALDGGEAGLGAELEHLARAVQTGLEAWRRTLEAELAARLELRHADLSALLWNEAGRRWDGPGGWALRVGGLGSLGLGAGAALARRHPLLAAGAAVGGLAAGKAREAVREHGLRGSAGLLPGGSELESAYRAALGEARLVAGRLAGEPDALGVPGGAALGERAAVVVDEAWTRLLERDLPSAAEAASTRAVRLTVDVPVYAFGLWLVARAALGFFDGDYVGVDMLLSAAIVAGAWLFVARTLVRRRLAGRAALLMDGVRQGAARELEEVAAQAAGPARENVEGALRSLERLAHASERWRGRLLAD